MGERMSPPTPADYNPYAAPPSSELPPSDGDRVDGARRAPGESVKWFYAVAAALSAVGFFLIRFSLDLDIDRATQKTLIQAVDGPLRWTLLGIATVWIYQAWSGIPAEARGDVSPAGAVGRLFIPLYSLYWVFGVNLRLCSAIDGLLIQKEDARRAPGTLAVAATVLHFAPVVLMLTPIKGYAFLVTIVDTVLWFTYMLQCDVVRRAVARNPLLD
jgi:hypothetical protein